MTLSGLFPSRTISIYVGKMFLVRTFVILAGMVLILQTLDLLTQSGDILAYHGNGQAQILHYVGLRAPQIIAFVLPFSVLLGTIITLATLNQNSEVIAMKASGLSAHQVLAPLIVASIAVAAISFTFNDRVVSRATATLDQWQDANYGPLPIDRGDRTNVWVRDGDDLIDVQQVRGKGGAAQLGGITVYDRHDGALVSIVTAPHGVRRGNGWLIGPRVQHFDVRSDTMTTTGPTTIASWRNPGAADAGDGRCRWPFVRRAEIGGR